MSHIYIQEPPALGKVLLKTTAGEIDVELWTKEAPKACRNFIQLCMEGYYNGTIFHRVVPEFIVQGGDPNGDGTGGESIYGEPFKDEFHSRLRFNRRGLVAMANAGKNDNGSQFFFTLGPTPELQNKHTIFGKVTGDSVYNMIKLSEGLINPDERPEHPHKITGATVLINPFEDIVPRVVETQVVEEPKKKKKREVKAIKNFGLLSFGDEEEEHDNEAKEYQAKPKSSHDLLEDPKLSKLTAEEMGLQEEIEQQEQSEKEKQEKTEQTTAAVNSIRDKLSSKKRESSTERDSKRKKEEEEIEEEEGEYYIGKDRVEARQKETDRIKREIKQLKRDMKAPKVDTPSVVIEEKQETKSVQDNEMYQKFVEEQEKYKKIKEKIPKKGQARNRKTKFTRKAKKKPWVKNLYENRQYPDNYTDAKFLEHLKRNLHVQKVTLSEAVVGSFRVVLRLCLCVLYAVIFVYMYNNWIQTHTVIYSSIIFTIISYILFVCVERSEYWKQFKTVLVYLVIGYLLSPILHTLTDTVSTDTIYAISVLMMLIHLIFFDYDVPAALVSKSLSINAAIFASVCLVSRLSSPFDAFILLTVGVIFFVLSPQFFKAYLHTDVFLLLFFVILCMTFVLLYTISVNMFCYFGFFVIVISCYCPVMFVRWQVYKDNIHGPWDEAVVNSSDDFEGL